MFRGGVSRFGVFEVRGFRGSGLELLVVCLGCGFSRFRILGLGFRVSWFRGSGFTRSGLLVLSVSSFGVSRFNVTRFGFSRLGFGVFSFRGFWCEVSGFGV